ncbi:hypothetical protein BJX96DRAFT_141184 [Aspergillus floccosus]
MGETSLVVRTFVIRRALTGFPVARNILAHSGLLLFQEDGRYFTLERLDGSSGIRCEQIQIQVLKTFEYYQSIRMDDLVWTKQRHGQAVMGHRTVEEVKDFLTTYAKENPYESRTQNCHMAQEALRRWLGQDVPEPTRMVKFANWMGSWIPQTAMDSSNAREAHKD